MTDLIMTATIAGFTIGFVLGVIVTLLVIGLCAGCLALRRERKAARQVGELVVALLLLVLSASAASAEPTWKLPTAAGRKAADIASWATAGTLVTLDAIHSAKADNPGRAFTVQGARIGVTYGGVWLAKTLVHRTRPCAPECGIDNPFLSFYSGHSATAGQAIGGARLSITLPLALGTGGLRILAGKHYFTDVVAGELAGYAASRWIR
jgi:membrane-associated phospholipid phosphatase